jgi:hypothetical protein
MLLVFFRALAVSEALRTTPLDKVSDDLGLAIFLQGWVACFYGGVLLIGIDLLLARTTARWVPLVLIAFVVLFPVSPHLGRVGMALQVLGLAVAFTGVAMAAVTCNQRALTHQPAF